MTKTMRTLVGSTVGGLVLLAAAGVAGGPLGVVHSAAGTQHASNVGYHLGNQAATGGKGDGTTATGGSGASGATSIGGSGNGTFWSIGGGANGVAANG